MQIEFAFFFCRVIDYILYVSVSKKQLVDKLVHSIRHSQQPETLGALTVRRPIGRGTPLLIEKKLPTPEANPAPVFKIKSQPL